MTPGTRRRRAILRDRRRDNRDAYLYGDPLIRALTGFDLYIAQQYADIAALERARDNGRRLREQLGTPRVMNVTPDGDLVPMEPNPFALPSEEELLRRIFEGDDAGDPDPDVGDPDSWDVRADGGDV